MQTFLPYANFLASARALDRKRLGKQRVEAYQILRTLVGMNKGWGNHPAVRMWRGYELALYNYGSVICLEWQARGYKDTVLEKLYAVTAAVDGPITMPAWLGNPDFHRSHQANLVAKDPEWYTPKFGALPWEPYVWPGEDKRGEKV